MANKQQVVYVERKHGLVHFVVFTVLFGVWYWLWLALKLCWRLVTWPFRFGAKVGWKTMIEWPYRACQAAWPHVVRGVQTFHTRYGWRGWGIVAAVVVVLGIIGTIMH